MAEQELQAYSEYLEDMVNERTRALQNAQEKMVRQERLATLGQLAGSVGHELRNPLGVISNAVYFLKMTQPDASATILDYLDIIEKETKISDKIVTDLLDFTRIKSDRPGECAGFRPVRADAQTLPGAGGRGSAARSAARPAAGLRRPAPGCPGAGQPGHECLPGHVQLRMGCPRLEN